MILILQAVLVMLVTVVPTLGESIDLPPVPEDSEHMVTLEGSEPLPPPAVLHSFEPIATQELPLEVASRQPRYVKNNEASSLPRTVIRYVTKTETVTKTVNISPTVVCEERPYQTQDCPPTSGVPQSSLPWLRVGRDCFVRFAEEMSWFDARALCQSHSLDLYQPKDLTAVAIYLKDNFDYKWHWLGGRGNGTHQVWLGGGALTREDPWFHNEYNNVATDQCLDAITFDWYPGSGKFLATEPCTWATAGVLCG